MNFKQTNLNCNYEETISTQAKNKYKNRRYYQQEWRNRVFQYNEEKEMTAGRIYLITNLFNGTRYVGQTTQSLEERYKAHCIDAKKKRNKNRKLYCAMNEFGYGSFKIEELEKVEDVAMLNIREIFWIEHLHTFENGYNETKGGKGTLIYDHKEII